MQTNRLIQEKIRDDIKQSLEAKKTFAEDLVSEVQAQRRIVVNL